MKTVKSLPRTWNEGLSGLFCWVFILLSCSVVRGTGAFEADVATNPATGMIEIGWQTEAGFLYSLEGSPDLGDWSNEATIYGLGQAVAVAVAEAPEPEGGQGGGTPASRSYDRYVSVGFVFRAFDNGKVLVSWSGSGGAVSVILPQGWTALGSIPAFSESYAFDEEHEDPENPGQFVTESVLYCLSCSLVQMPWAPGLASSVPEYHADGTYVPDILSEADKTTFGVLWMLLDDTGCGGGPGRGVERK